MTEEINNILKSSETFEEFIAQADTLIAREIAKEADISEHNVLSDEVCDRAKEYWDEFVNSEIPF